MWCVVSREVALGALALQKLCELIAGVLASPVRSESLDANSMLRLSPICEPLVSLKGLILGLE
jgi:hypothetical protein